MSDRRKVNRFEVEKQKTISNCFLTETTRSSNGNKVYYISDEEIANPYGLLG